MSQTSFGIGKSNGNHRRTGSAIAEALVNVANVAGVSSGRKISSSATPWKTISETDTATESKDDLPPTYSTVTANVGTLDVQKEPAVEKKNLGDQGCNDLDSNHHDLTPEKEATSYNMSNSHSSHQLGAGAMNDSDKPSEHLSLSCGQLEEDEPAVNGVLPESPTVKSRKRLSWFGKRQDSITESESSSAPENEDETRRKVRWLWRLAVRKSKGQSNPVSKTEDGAPMATSLEKLKSG